MFNPASLLKLKNNQQRFAQNHPKFSAFIGRVFGGGVPVGTVLEITVTKPGENPITSNIRLSESDLEFFNSIKDIGNN